ncbi:MAG: XrtA/PEP-CTERM system exopolysaccharide export protein [Pseudomonadota bacterium]
MNKIKRMAAVGAAMIAAVLTGCASGGGVPASDCPIPEASLSDYRIGVGDLLRIVVWRNEELSATVPVRPDGRISTPLVDDMMAQGMTPSNLAQSMEEVLGEYLRTPEVSVIVENQGAANQIQVLGEVTTPQSLSYREGLTLLDVIVTVGGLTDFASGNRASLIRQINGQQTECRVRLADISDGRLADNIKVYPGDVLVVPESRF